MLKFTHLMKVKIHPKYHNNCKVTCACGNTFTTGSTLPEIKVEICAACHPFFTGEMKYVDTQGRVEAFQKKMAKARTHIKKKAQKTKKKQKKEKETERPKTLKEMLTKGKRKKTKKKPKSKKTPPAKKTSPNKSQIEEN